MKWAPGEGNNTLSSLPRIIKHCILNAAAEPHPNEHLTPSCHWLLSIIWCVFTENYCFETLPKIDIIQPNLEAIHPVSKGKTTNTTQFVKHHHQ